jgi:hypothetical protein
MSRKSSDATHRRIVDVLIWRARNVLPKMIAQEKTPYGKDHSTLR